MLTFRSLQLAWVATLVTMRIICVGKSTRCGITLGDAMDGVHIKAQLCESSCPACARPYSSLADIKGSYGHDWSHRHERIRWKCSLRTMAVASTIKASRLLISEVVWPLHFPFVSSYTILLEHTRLIIPLDSSSTANLHCSSMYMVFLARNSLR